VQVLQGGPTRPFVYAPAGSLAALGCRTGVAKVFGVKLSGLWAWALWRTVYLMKMPGWPRRLRVALDWTNDLLFRRDYVQLGVHRTRRRPPG
jgi:NADH dehydrogenase